jgi:hypothetical protein
MADESIKNPDGLTDIPKEEIKRNRTKTKDLNPIARFRLKPINLKVLGLERPTLLPPDKTRA